MAEEEAARDRSRSKSILLLGIGLAAVVALAATTQPWVTLTLAEGASAADSLSVTGQQTNPSLSPVAIAVLASALALTIAGPVLRRIMGALVALLGVGISAMAIAPLADPLAAAAGSLAEVTGIAGTAQADLVVAVSQSPFIPLTLGAGIALILLGILVIVFAGRWRSAGRRYQSSADRASEGRAGAQDRISEWDEMSQGIDPTSSE